MCTSAKKQEPPRRRQSENQSIERRRQAQQFPASWHRPPCGVSCCGAGVRCAPHGPRGRRAASHAAIPVLLAGAGAYARPRPRPKAGAPHPDATNQCTRLRVCVLWQTEKYPQGREGAAAAAVTQPPAAPGELARIHGGPRAIHHHHHHKQTLVPPPPNAANRRLVPCARPSVQTRRRTKQSLSGLGARCTLCVCTHARTHAPGTHVRGWHAGACPAHNMPQGRVAGRWRKPGSHLSTSRTPPRYTASDAASGAHTTSTSTTTLKRTH